MHQVGWADTESGIAEDVQRVHNTCQVRILRDELLGVQQGFAKCGSISAEQLVEEFCSKWRLLGHVSAT